MSISHRTQVSPGPVEGPTPDTTVQTRIPRGVSPERLPVLKRLEPRPYSVREPSTLYKGTEDLHDCRGSTRINELFGHPPSPFIIVLKE